MLAVGLFNGRVRWERIERGRELERERIREREKEREAGWEIS